MSNCDVCLYGDTDFDNDFYHEQKQRARKAHICCECRQPIRPGDLYQRASGRSDGTVWTYKTCRFCVEVRTTFYCEGGWYFGQLWEEMTEQAFPYLTTASGCFRELSADAKAFLMERWQTWKFPASSTVGRAESEA